MYFDEYDQCFIPVITENGKQFICLKVSHINRKWLMNISLNYIKNIPAINLYTEECLDKVAGIKFLSMNYANILAKYGILEI